MPKQININEAKTRLSQLVDRAANGEEIVIARSGRPVARLVAWRPRPVARKAGRLRGRVRVGRDIDAPLPSDLFETDRS